MDNQTQQPQPETSTPPQTPQQNQSNMPMGHPQQQSSGGDGMGIASMVLGILSLVLFWIWFIGGILALIGLVLGIVARSKKKTGQSLAGIITSAIGLVLSVLSVIFIIWVFNSAADEINDSINRLCEDDANSENVFCE